MSDTIIEVWDDPGLRLRAMKTRILTLGAAILLPVAALGLWLAAIAASGHQPDSVQLQASSDSTVIIDSNVGETFTPDSSKAPPTGILSPDEAYRGFSGTSADIPPGISVQLGYLTLPVGPGSPGEYTGHNELVYAYTWISCAPQIGPTPPPGSKSSDQTLDSLCKQWLFMDASSGKMVDMTWTK